MSITIKEKPQLLGCLQDHVPALSGNPHMAHSHRQGHSLAIHSDLWAPSQAHNLASYTDYQMLKISSRILLKYNDKIFVPRIWVADLG